MKARLYALGGRDAGRVFEIEGEALLGRDRACQVQLGDPSVSRRHARILWSGSEWILEDLGSRNGTRLRARGIERAGLADHDELVLGECPLRFRVEGGGAAPSPPAQAPAEPPLEPPLEIELEPEIGAVPEVARAAQGERSAGPASAAEELRRRALAVEGRRARASVLSGELEQRPFWWRALLFLAALLAGALVAFGAFQLVRLLRTG